MIGRDVEESSDLFGRPDPHLALTSARLDHAIGRVTVEQPGSHGVREDFVEKPVSVLVAGLRKTALAIPAAVLPKRHVTAGIRTAAVLTKRCLPTVRTGLYGGPLDFPPGPEAGRDAAESLGGAPP